MQLKERAESAQRPDHVSQNFPGWTRLHHPRTREPSDLPLKLPDGEPPQSDHARHLLKAHVTSLKPRRPDRRRIGKELKLVGEQSLYDVANRQLGHLCNGVEG